MNPKSALRAVSVIACLHGLLSVVPALLMNDMTLFHRVAALSSGALLLVSAWLLWRERKAALPLLWLSVAIYAFSVLYPAVSSHGLSALGMLVTAFYWSVGIRLLIALAAHATFAAAHASTLKDA